MPRTLPQILPPTRRTLLAGAMVLSASAAAAQDNKTTQPIEGKKGATILGPRDPTRENENHDFIQPPDTDHGALPNLRYSFSDTHIKMRDGGWSREVTARELPAAKTIAGVTMRLTAGGVRELHWHKEAEWAFMLAGKARITAVDNDGHNFVDDVANLAIFGIFPRAFRIRSKACSRTARNSCWLVRTSAEGCAGQELWDQSGSFRSHSQTGAIHLRSACAACLVGRYGRQRTRPRTSQYEIQTDGLNADACAGWHSSHRRHAQFRHLKRYCCGAGRGRARSHA